MRTEWKRSWVGGSYGIQSSSPALAIAQRAAVHSAARTEAELAEAQTSWATKMYLTLNQAIHAGDKAGILAAIEPERRAMMDSPEFPEMLKLVQSMTPKNVRVRRVVETAEQAVITATAEHERGRVERGRITLKRGPNGQWFMAGEDWRTP